VLGPGRKAVDFRVEYVNAVAQRYAGLPRERYEGRLITDVVPNAEESGFLALYRQVWDTGEPIVEDEYPYQGPGELYGRGCGSRCRSPGWTREWPSPGGT
jgi:PAS domain-containing protein